jgi:di/tricarboxylate transporter
MFNSLPGMEGTVNFDSWFSTNSIPIVTIAALLIVGNLVFLKPRDKLSRAAVDSIRNEQADKISRDEIVTAAILVLFFALMVTSGIHHLPDTAICLGAVFLLFLFGVLETKDISAGVSWDLIIFLAMALSLTTLFSTTGISVWLADIVVPALAPIATNPWLFVYTMVIILFLWRFVDVAMFLPTIAILTPLLPTISITYGISPLVWIGLFVMVVNAHFVAYQNIFVVMGQSIAKEQPWAAKHLAMQGAIYFFACLIALLIATPLWISVGYFG